MRKLTQKRLSEYLGELLNPAQPQPNGTPRLLDFLKRNRVAAPMPRTAEQPVGEEPPEPKPIVEPRNKRYPFMRR